MSGGGDKERRVKEIDAELERVEEYLKKTVVGRCEVHQITLGMVVHSGCVLKCFECSHYDTLELYRSYGEVVKEAEKYASILDSLREERASLIKSGEDRFDEGKFYLAGSRHCCEGVVATVEEKPEGYVVIGLKDAKVGEERFNFIYARISRRTFLTYKDVFTPHTKLRFRAEAYLRNVGTYYESIALRRVSTLEVERDGLWVKPEKSGLEDLKQELLKERESLKTYVEQWMSYVKESSNAFLYGRGIAVALKLARKSRDVEYVKEVETDLKELIKSWLSSTASLNVVSIEELSRVLGVKIKRRSGKAEALKDVLLKPSEEDVEEVMNAAVKIFKYVRRESERRAQDLEWRKFLKQKVLTLIQRGLEGSK
ncbi:MAG: hypothetical protein B7O98_06515 [Zestosphaera tikiterensis]|uniref:Uncharacterized protein n=1 Tax=Zestosphaera tikiterensis TaxID=1973259 RepID=A0A2R7Y462_9CREN|nr:MAG: hypothetical protein B7O98_06515 [Zestosphaera tikiterensis]